MHTVTTTQENPHVRKKKRKKERTRKKHMRTLIFRSQSVNFMDSTFFSCFQFVCNGVILIASNNDKPIN